MAKAQERQGTEYVALPKGVIDTVGSDEPVSDEELAFDEFVSSMSAERMGELRVGKIKVAKDGTPIANTRSAHCFACPIDQFTYSSLVEHIRARHGAGLYRIVGTETGKRGLVFNRLLEIAEELVQPGRPAENPLQNPANVLESVGRIMAESQARTEGLIARLTEAKPVAADPMDMMTKMAGLFATIMGVVPKQAVGTGDDLLGQLEKLAKIKELLGGFGGGGDSDKESNFFDVVKAGLNSFGPALGALAVKTMQNVQPILPAPDQPAIGTAPALSGGALSGGALSPAQSPAPQSTPVDITMKKQVDALVANAKMNVDPNLLAQSILNLTPDDKLDDLGDMLESPDMIDKMALLNPDVKTYRDFFERLRQALLSLLDSDDSPTLAAGDLSGGSADGTGAPTA